MALLLMSSFELVHIFFFVLQNNFLKLKKKKKEKIYDLKDLRSKEMT